VRKNMPGFLSLAPTVLALILGLAGPALAIVGDLDGYGSVDWIDISIFTNRWLDTGCSADSWCDGADIDHSTNVDFNDFALLAQNWFKEASIQVVESNEGFTIMEGEEEVLFYQRQPKSLDGQYSRCNYVHPLYGLDGETLTEDFPDDHLHHRGIFWAWHQILIDGNSVSDGWSLENFSQDVCDVEILVVDLDSTALKLHVLWKSPLWTDGEGVEKPFVKETTIIRVYSASAGIRKIDFQISLLALEDEVCIGGADNEKGYGGFSPRIRMPDDLVFTGTNGPVTPTDLPIEAGPWMDFSAGFGDQGQVSGLAVLCHDTIPGYPTPWILRQTESMQNAVYPGRYPVPVSRETPLVLCYRLVVHQGDDQQVNLDELQAQYNTEDQFNPE